MRPHRKPVIHIDDLLEAVRESTWGMGLIGICRHCGDWREGCEPDARNYPCENCGRRQVFGAQELLLMGEYYE